MNSLSPASTFDAATPGRPLLSGSSRMMKGVVEVPANPFMTLHPKRWCRKSPRPPVRSSEYVVPRCPACGKIIELGLCRCGVRTTFMKRNLSAIALLFFCGCAAASTCLPKYVPQNATDGAPGVRSPRSQLLNSTMKRRYAQLFLLPALCLSSCAYNNPRFTEVTTNGTVRTLSVRTFAIWPATTQIEKQRASLGKTFSLGQSGINEDGGSTNLAATLDALTRLLQQIK